MKSRGRQKILACVMAALAFSSTPMSNARAQDVLTISSGRTSLITVEKGKPKTIRTHSSFYEIVVGDPEIANVQPLTNRSFYVLGINAGTTGIALFDEQKNLIGSVDVEVSVDTTRLKTAIRENVPDANIKVTTTNGQVVLSGSAPDQVSADRAKKIAGKFAGNEDEIINSVNVTSSQQVQLNVRFVEINRNAGQELGVKINDLSYNSETRKSDLATIGYASVGNFMGSLVSGGLNVDVAIKAMEDRGVARRLAEPNLVARSGETASFLAGGEFPIAVTGKNGEVSIYGSRYWAEWMWQIAGKDVTVRFDPDDLQAGLSVYEMDGTFLGDVGLSKPAGEQDRSALEMIWSRPTAEINGIIGGYTGDGFKTVLPSKATAKVSFRLVGQQDPHALREHFRAWVRAQLPEDVSVDFHGHGASPASQMQTTHPAFESARSVLGAEWGHEAAFTGCGGSIPVAVYFKSILDMDTMLVGWGKDDDQIHSPNEKYDVESFHKGIRSWARILDAIR